jgi:hypothetical protein
MAHLEPTAALTTCEQALRELYARAYTEAFGPGWLDLVATADRRNAWRAKREVERARRTRAGVAVVPEDELAYAEFWELCEIAEAHWAPLASALGKQKQMLPLLRRFESLRNTVAHSRPVLPFEADLLSGIAGEIRNRVTIHMIGQDPSGEYFARIETVVDSLGHEILADASSSATGFATDVTLRVGDVVHFTCHATDPHDRPIRWEIATVPGGAGAVAEGADVELAWTVEDRHVSQSAAVVIAMTSDSLHHRIEGKVDGRVIFYYRVLPGA